MLSVLASVVNVILTGGDDGTFKLWDLRTINTSLSLSSCDNNNDVSSNPPTPIAISKYHSAGVTSAQYHPTYQHVFATGSYDNNICIWDDRFMKTPICANDTGRYLLQLLQP